MVLAKYILYFFMCIAAFGCFAHAYTCQQCDWSKLTGTNDKNYDNCYSGKTNTTCVADSKMGCVAYTYQGHLNKDEAFELVSRACQKLPLTCEVMGSGHFRDENATGWKCTVCFTDLCNSADFNSA